MLRALACCRWVTGDETLDAPLTVYLQLQLDDDSTRSFFIRIGAGESPGGIGRQTALDRRPSP